MTLSLIIKTWYLLGPFSWSHRGQYFFCVAGLIIIIIIIIIIITEDSCHAVSISRVEILGSFYNSLAILVLKYPPGCFLTMCGSSNE